MGAPKELKHAVLHAQRALNLKMDHVNGGMSVHVHDMYAFMQVRVTAPFLNPKCDGIMNIALNSVRRGEPVNNLSMSNST